MKTSISSCLSNETRLKLLVCLSKGSKNVTELISNCNLSQSAVSQHLEKLRSCGLVATERQGKEIYYSLTYPQVADLSKKILSFISEFNQR